MALLLEVRSLRPFLLPLTCEAMVDAAVRGRELIHSAVGAE